MNVPLNSSTPIKTSVGRRSHPMPWLCATSPIKQSSRPTDTTASSVSSAGVFSLKFEIASSEEECIIPKRMQIKKSSSNRIKLAAKSEKNRDRIRSRDLNIEAKNDETVSGLTLPKRKKLESAAMKQTSTTRNLFKKTASTWKNVFESSDSEEISTGKPTVHKTERTTLMTGKGRKKLEPTKDQSDASSKDKRKTSTVSPLKGRRVKKSTVPGSPVGNIAAVVPLRKSSVHIQSKTVSVTENGSSKTKKRPQLGSATKSLEVVKRNIDFGREKFEEPLRSSVVKDVVQNKSVRFSMGSNKILNSSASRNTGCTVKGKTNTGKKKSTSLQSTQSNKEFEGRSSKRKRVPTSAFWLGQALYENENIVGTKSTRKVQPKDSIDNEVTKKKPCLTKEVKDRSSLNKKTPIRDTVKKKSNAYEQTDNEVTKKKPRLTKEVKDRATVKKKTPIRDTVKKKIKSYKQTVCCAAFNEAQFEPHGEEDTCGILRATGMFLSDMESQFIQLPPHEETGDLCSYLYNQLYTVLENQISLEIDGILKVISLYGQFHICKGVLHRVINKTSKKSLVQRIIIHK